jgi:hypothetical protein
MAEIELNPNADDPDHFDPEGPDEDDAESMYDPTEIEASRARELGLGLGERDLRRQRDVPGDGPGFADGDVERLSSDQLSADADISDSDANHLEIDEEFDSEDDSPDAERLDDRARGVSR